MEEHKKHCDVCNVDFNKTRDYDKHIKTNKHIKNTFNIDKSKCPYCEYSTDDLGNMNKHIKAQHKETKIKIEQKIEKEFKEASIPKNIIKTYLSLKETQLSLVIKLSAFKCRYKRLKNRMFKDTEDLVIETRNNYNLALMDYNNTNIKLEELLKQYPNLIKEEIPTKKIDSKDDEKDEEETNKQIIEEDKKIISAQNLKHEKINFIKSEIENLIEQYKISRGDKNILNKILEKENELKNIV